MAQITWLTPQGSLGTIAEKEYFQFQFDAYNSNGHSVSYKFIAGQLATGFEVSQHGLLFGIPVMDLTPITPQSFVQIFTIRAYDFTDPTVLTDRTFNITLNPVALPSIYPLNVSLGTYEDATYLDIQLLETDPNPLIPLVWTLVNGELPRGTTLTSTGRLYGFILPTVVTGSETSFGWDTSLWDINAWDLNTPEASVKNYVFTVQLYDGSRYDKTTFSIVVTASSAYTADNDQLSIDSTHVTIDRTPSHNPYISTPPQYLPVQRELSNFSFQIVGVDLDSVTGNTLTYNLLEPANFTISNVAPINPSFGDQWWDLVNNQILIYAFPAAVTPAKQLAIGSEYTITSLGTGETIVSFIATPPVTPSTVIGVPTGTYRFETTVDGNATVNQSIPVSNTDTMTSLAATLQTNILGNVIVSAIDNNLVFLSTSTGPNAEVLITTPAPTGNDLIIAMNNALNSASTTTETRATDFTVLGALNNNIGTTFVANNVGFGTGTASLTTWEVMIPNSDLVNVDLTTISNVVSPPGLTIDANTGWIRGTNVDNLVTQQQTYVFQAQCHKTITPTFISDPVTYVLTVLGSLTNTINWLTPTFVGTINGGAVSELFVEAVSSEGFPITYTLNSGQLPPGLYFDTATGIIYGRVSEVVTTFDNNTTTFDSGSMHFVVPGQGPFYTFEVTAYATGAQNTRTFTIEVTTSLAPYENLYMRSLPAIDQRILFHNIINNTEIFPDNLIYRANDPWFGKSTDIKFLFAAGLSVNTAAIYESFMQDNQFNKSINMGNVKTAVALDANFKVKYEVVYLEVVDPQQVDSLIPPAFVTETVPNVTVYSNNLNVMKAEVVNGIGYSNQGAIPEWMLSVQPNGLVLGFTYGVVLAYTVPGASSLIAYRLSQNNVTFNDLSFVVDRYELNQATGVYSLPEVGDVYLKFPRTTTI